MTDKLKLSQIEYIKAASRGLRGTIAESLDNELTGSISDDDQALIKFHGMYQQDDRDRREERAAKKLERLYSFMIRLRLPGGFLKPDQWLAMHHIAGENATGVIKITTRQTVQLHGIVKSKIKPTIKSFNLADLDSIATCGDINRNVLCSSHPMQSPQHEEIFAYADKISALLKPKTRAYYEIWLDEEKLVEKTEDDPLYQDRYMPRKFKIAIAIPPNNDVDVFANDLGLIAIVEDAKLKGFNIAVGGGLSTTHGNPNNYARLATEIGFINADEEKLFKVIYEVLAIQRDYGNRSDRKLARLKYTIDRLGIDWFKEELERRINFKLEAPKAVVFNDRADYYGWEQNHKGLWYYTAFVENGRVLDTEQFALKTALFEIAGTGKTNFLFTANQNLIISDVAETDKDQINELLAKHGVLDHTSGVSAIRKNAMACVAFNTCPLALAEGQRYLPQLISKIELLLERHSLLTEPIVIRMTGCPNGCARPYLAEIGFVGTSYGHYNLHLGGDRYGMRLNKIYKQGIDEATILSELDYLFSVYCKERLSHESFGDFTLRKEWV